MMKENLELIKEEKEEVDKDDKKKLDKMKEDMLLSKNEMDMFISSFFCVYFSL